MKTVKIYCDSGADISKLKKIACCKFYQFPYDSPHRPKKPFLLAVPSAAQWQDCHCFWDELKEITFDDFEGSDLYSEIEGIIGDENRRDVLHFDSAYKTECKIFLTSDKGDIWSNRSLLEERTGIKTFFTPSELKDILEYFKILKIPF